MFLARLTAFGGHRILEYRDAPPSIGGGQMKLGNKKKRSVKDLCVCVYEEHKFLMLKEEAKFVSISGFSSTSEIPTMPDKFKFGTVEQLETVEEYDEQATLNYLSMTAEEFNNMPEKEQKEKFEELLAAVPTDWDDWDDCDIKVETTEGLFSHKGNEDYPQFIFKAETFSTSHQGTATISREIYRDTGNCTGYSWDDELETTEIIIDLPITKSTKSVRVQNQIINPQERTVKKF